jgi:hypothetical protein
MLRLKRFAWSSRTGVAIFLVVGFLIVSLLFMFQFYAISRESRWSAQRFKLAAVLNEVAESAIDEGWQRLATLAGDPQADVYRQLISGEPRILDLEASGKLRTRMLLSELVFFPFEGELKVTCEVKEKFGQRQVGKNRFPFFSAGSGESEGVTVVELVALAEIAHRSSQSLRQSHEIRRQHLVKISSLKTNPVARNSYVQNALLDHVLFLGRAKDQHNASPKNTFFMNPTPPARLVVNPLTNRAKPGFVCLTGSGEGFLFLNIAKNYEKLLPPTDKKWETKKEYFTLDECALIFPEIAESKDDYKGLFGELEVGISPILPSKQDETGDVSGDSEEKQRNKQIREISVILDKETSKHPCVEILGETPDPQLLKDPKTSPIRGDIRGRFLYWSRFRLNLSRMDLSAKERKELQAKKAEDWMPILPASFIDNGSQQKDDQAVRKMMESLEKLNVQKNSETDPQLISSLTVAFPLGELDASPLFNKSIPFPPAKPAPKTGYLNHLNESIPDFRYLPFLEPYLWFQKGLTVDSSAEKGSLKYSLENTGVIDRTNGIINVRQYHVVETNQNADPQRLILKSDKNDTFIIRGKGVIIADEIIIQSGIEKASEDDFLILFSRKLPLRVQTSKKIHAFLCATNVWAPAGQTQGIVGEVIAEEELDLSGGLAACVLDLSRWAKKTHHLEYDPIFFGDTNLFSPAILRKVLFLRHSAQ